MTLQIAFGIFFGFLFLAIFVGLIFGIAYIIGSRQEQVPKYMKEPKRSIKEWWDGDEEEDDYP